MQKLKKGVHYRNLTSDLSAENTVRVLSVLERPEILNALEQNRIDSIYLQRLSEKSNSAYYDHDTGAVTINTARKLGIQFGAKFDPGVVSNMSRATTDKLESMQRALLQELAHHLERNSAEVAAIRDAAFSSGDKRPITRYARTDGSEYLAESLVAHYFEPEALASFDPIGSKMIKSALDALRK